MLVPRDRCVMRQAGSHTPREVGAVLSVVAMAASHPFIIEWLAPDPRAINADEFYKNTPISEAASPRPIS